MKPLPIQLRQNSSPVDSRPVAAGWLSSDNPEHWLGETTRLHHAGMKKSPGILPVTLDGITHGAVLMLPENEAPALSHRVTPLVYILPNVLSLKNAELSLGLLEHEVRSLAFPGKLYLFLPGPGLIALERTSVLKPQNLIILEKRNVAWNLAQPGPPAPPRLNGIRVELPEAEDLGLESDGIGDLKGKKIDPSGPLGKIGKGIGMGLGGLAAGPILGLGKIVRMLPDGPGSHGPTAFDKLEEWAKKNWKQITDARQRELDKLMELMDKNPEQGLRYALPLNGHEARRGKAAPSWTLGMNNLRLGSSQGGGAVDGWDLDYQTQLRLEKQYRKAASDAEANNNHERAAYIYGELLGDWAAAADALIKAGRHRDAVAIFLHKLSDKNRAARALEEAGLTLQAAELYLELKKFEKAGDLFFELHQEERARDLWQEAVDQANDPLEKSRILHTKIGNLPAAIKILDESWRKGTQTKACLKAQFKLLLQNDDLSPLHRLIEDFGQASTSTLAEIEKARLAVELKNNVLEKDFHPALEELVLNLSSKNLLQNPTSKSGHELLAQLKLMQEDDHLLARDTTRFVAKNKNIATPSSASKRGHLDPSFILGIPQEGHWQSLACLGENTSVAGVSSSSLVVAQLQGRSCMGSELKTDEFTPTCRQVFHLGLIGNPNKERVFHFPSTKRVHFRSLNTSRTPSHDALGSLQNVLAIGAVDDDSFMALQYHKTNSLVAQIYGASGAKLETVVLDLAPPEMAEPRWFCAQRNNHSCFSANCFAAWRYPDGQIAACQLNEPIHKLVLTPRFLPVHALISSPQEVALLIPGKSGKVPEFVNLYMSDLGHPCFATFAKNGDIVVISGNRGEVSKTTNYASASATFSFPEALGHTIDIAPRGASGFVILTSKGRLILFD